MTETPSDADREKALLPCPFCGGEPDYQDIAGGGVIIRCGECEAESACFNRDRNAEDAWNARTASAARAEGPAWRKIETLFDAIKHGDDDHRRWLKDAIEAHFAGRPVPPPYGKGALPAPPQSTPASHKDEAR